MLNDREFSLLAYLKQTCSKGYFLISVSAIVDYLKPDGVTAEQVGQTVIGLDEKGYLELKYFDGEEFLIKLLPPCFSLKKKEEKVDNYSAKTVVLPPFDKKDKFRLFFLSFLGGILGSLIASLIGVFLC